MKSSESNVPSADKRSRESVFVNDGLEIVCVSLGVIIFRLEGLTTLALSARVITDEVKVLEEFGIIELFLKRQSGTRETGDKDDGWFGRVTSSMGPDLGTVLGPYELSERGHNEGIRVLSTDRLMGGRTEKRMIGGVTLTAKRIL